MRFFVPFANDLSQAEERYRNLREQVTARMGPVADRRLYRLQFTIDGKRRTLAVGDCFHARDGHPVLAIFSNEDQGVYYVCTAGAPNQEIDSPLEIMHEAEPVAEEFTRIA